MDTYESIIRNTYQCAILSESVKRNLLPEDEFVALCLSEITLDYKELRKYLEGKHEWLKKDSETPPPMNSRKLLNRSVDEYLRNEFGDNHNLLLANIIYLLDCEDTTSFYLLNSFQRIKIIQEYDYDYFLYILGFVKLKYDILNYKSFLNNNFYTFSGLISKFDLYVIDVEKTITILGEELFKNIFLIGFEKYMNLHENNLVSFGYNRVFDGYVLETLMVIMKYFDTYKWLSEEDKKKLISFSESSKIFYKEHYNYLSNKKANKYLSRMTEAVINGEGMVV